MNENKTEKRLTALHGILILGGILLAGKLFFTQVVQHDYWVKVAKGQHEVSKDLAPSRGQIFASDMYPLATNKTLYSVSVVPKNLQDKHRAAKALADILGTSEKEIYEKINNDKLYLPPLGRRLTEEVAQKISQLDMTGVIVVPENERTYPEGKLAAHLLGFVNAEGNGQYGVEGYWNELLKGLRGSLQAARDSKGRVIDIEKENPPTDGTDVVLTIDHTIQYMVEEKLEDAVEKFGAKGGQVVVADPKTGRILAMAGRPSFDPNTFNEVPKDQSNIFSNPNIANAWEPGSVFKPIVMGAALDQDKVQPDTEGVFSNMVKIGGYEIHTAQDKAFGRETMTQVLENSDNVAMVWVAEQLGNETMAKYMQDFGFGSKTGVELDVEAPGKLLEVSKWKDVNRATMAFGQGISVTPIQLLMAYGAIANGGKLMRPQIINSILYPDGRAEEVKPQETRQVLKPETVGKLIPMLVSVVQKGHGKKAGVDGYLVAGKTGTAQIPNPAGGYYEDRHIGSFGGFAPANDPKFAMVVRLDEPQGVEFAESSAAPLFGDIAKALLSYLKVPPSS